MEPSGVPPLDTHWVFHDTGYDPGHSFAAIFDVPDSLPSGLSSRMMRGTQAVKIARA